MSNWFADKLGPDPRQAAGAPAAKQQTPTPQRAPLAPQPQAQPAARAPEPPRQPAAAPPPRAAAPAPAPAPKVEEPPKKKKGWF